MSDSFPLPLVQKEIHWEFYPETSPDLLVCAMVWGDEYLKRTDNLKRSCEEFGMAGVICEMPTVHFSMSHKGTDDARYTKANFICSMLETYQRPILYVDSDCFFSEYPACLVAKHLNYDFAVYNWLADTNNAAYIPVQIISKGDGSSHPEKERYYRFSHSIEFYSDKQLISSGCVQYYNNTLNARLILERWHAIVCGFSGCADDHCLDYTYNNYVAEQKEFRVLWLDKAYARYPWWIDTKPVISHLDMPDSEEQWPPLPETENIKRVYPERLKACRQDLLIPRNAILDTVTGQVYEVRNDGLIPVRIVTRQFWI